MYAVYNSCRGPFFHPSETGLMHIRENRKRGLGHHVSTRKQEQAEQGSKTGETEPV